MQTVYDELPYPGEPFSQTHPDRLATLATFFGMTPASVESCRVLELGCGDGANLIPMAFALPEGRFRGIDLAGSAIIRGQELIQKLHLENIRLQHLDVMTVDSDFGEFDYIIAHGLYSWVPPQVREKILEICRSHLAANGVAFISYNAYPGGHLNDTIREMVRFHTRNTTGVRERLKQARELLELLVEAHPENNVDGLLLRQELKSFRERKPEYFYHDEMSEHNHRFYFHEFVEQVTRHGLQYLSEIRLLNMQVDVHTPEISDKIRAFTQDDELAREQYLDFLKLRSFRQTLVCHSEVPLDRKIDPERITHMSAASDAQPSSPEPDIRSTLPLEFKYPSGGSMSTNHPLAKCAMLHLGRTWPQAVPFPELLREARALSGRDASSPPTPAGEDRSWLSDMVLKLYAANFLELHVHAPVFTGRASERPVASELARAQVQRGPSVANLRHGSIQVEDDVARELLGLLDGTRDRAQVLMELRRRSNSSEITAEKVDSNLDRLAKMALLVA